MKDTSNFIKTIMEEDKKNNPKLKIITRFPPEPNGYLHIGHARAIIINFELAKLFKGKTNLRFDDTNPDKEETEYVKAIMDDVAWLGYKPNKVLFASDYFDEMYKRAIILIKQGLAYVDNQTPEEIQKTRGTLKMPGKESPYRNRSVEENLELFEKMKNGEFKEGEAVLRAKVSMSDSNLNNRDPIIYRILYQTHHNTKDKWVIYPMYDYAHPLEDAIEGITHSLCSLEFEDHRPIYNWFVKNTKMPHKPRQIEFGRLNIESMKLSKRYLRELVSSGLVSGWDDPRMPTLKGMKKRGYTPNAIKNFIINTGLSKTNGEAKLAMLEHFIREDLQTFSEPINGIIDPLLVEITNYNKGIEEIKVPYKFKKRNRKTYFGKYLYIDRNDFVKDKPNRKYKRLYLGGEVRLMNAYFIKCHDIVYNKDGEIEKILCTYDPLTKSGTDFNERKPNGTINYVEKETAVSAIINTFEPLLLTDSDNIKEQYNPDSKKVFNGFIEPSIKQAKEKERFQFIRQGYFIIDDIKDGKPIFNEIVKLKSSIK